MILVTSNKARQLLCLCYLQRIQLEDLQRSVEELKVLLTDLSPGFCLLVDLSQMEIMDLDCVPEIGRMMDLIDQYGVSLIVRVIPDPKKDIGLSIMTLFHYRNRPRFATCESLSEAIRVLEL